MFNQDAVVFRTEQKQQNASGTTGDGAEMQIHFNMPEEITYTDLKTGATVEQRDLMGKKFLVSGDATRRKWQMTGKQKEILSYPCQEAVSYGKDTLFAWFTTSIPVSAGPPEWRGLPGMVMEASRVVGEGGSYTIKATKVEEGVQALSAPKEGKKVTKAEFDKIQKEKQKEMEEQFGGSHGNGRMMIRVER
jgi:GLPGLI family protein